LGIVVGWGGTQRLAAAFGAWRQRSAARQRRRFVAELDATRREVGALIELHQRTRQDREQAQLLAGQVTDQHAQQDTVAEERHGVEMELLRVANASLREALETARAEAAELRRGQARDREVNAELRGQLLDSQRTNTRLCEQLLHDEQAMHPARRMPTNATAA
jgi:hypothetical protein